MGSLVRRNPNPRGCSQSFWMGDPYRWARTSRCPPAIALSQRSKERQQFRTVSRVQMCETVAGPRALTVMCGDRVFDRQGAAVMEKRLQRPQSPERRGAHFATLRVPLIDVVAERAHVVEEEIGVGMVGLVVERGDLARAAVERRGVAGAAADPLEHLLSVVRVSSDLAARRR